jgi:hypothetical protein
MTVVDLRVMTTGGPVEDASESDSRAAALTERWKGNTGLCAEKKTQPFSFRTLPGALLVVIPCSVMGTTSVLPLLTVEEDYSLKPPQECGCEW